MIYCRNCGNQCADHTQFCPVCGASLQTGYNTQQPNGYVQQPNGTYYYQQPVEEDKPETALCVLSFFFWIVGVVLYAVNSATKPNAAKAYLGIDFCGHQCRTGTAELPDSHAHHACNCLTKKGTPFGAFLRRIEPHKKSTQRRAFFLCIGKR